MNGEKIKPSHEHRWVYRLTEGAVNELTTDRIVTAMQVQAVLENPTRAMQLYPGGRIVCATCTEPLFSEQKQGTILPDLNEIRNNLIGK